MHSVKRVKQSKEAIEARKKKEAALLVEYLALEADVLGRKRSRDYSDEALQLTARLLKLNFEYYTIWNFRRHILERGTFSNATPERINEVLAAELNFTSTALRQHPKVYWIWNHRRWCLEHVPDGPSEQDVHGWKMANWQKELFVVEKMLDADPRNFHAWTYRRYILSSLPIPRPAADELAFTRRKIEANFSNFSAWHQRSKVFSALWTTQDLESIRAAKDAEFTLVKNALFIDPNDQSGWLYHRWLVGDGSNKEMLEREIGVISQILEIEPDSKWCLDSLVHYKQLLLRGQPSGAGGEVPNQECAAMLEKLEEIDSLRRRRYQDLREPGLRDGS